VAQEPEASSPHSQQPATGPCLEPVESNPHPQANLPKIHYDPIFSPTPWSSKWSPSVGLSHKNLVHLSLLSHACHMPRPHSPWLDLPNGIWGWVQIMKFLIVQLPLFSCHLIPSYVQIFFSEPCSQTPAVFAWETKFHTHTKQLVELWLNSIYLFFLISVQDHIL
jgi:hypothetical protein